MNCLSHAGPSNAFEEPVTTLSVLLDRVKAELEGLTHLVADMQTGLTPLLVDQSPGDPDAFRHAQNIDLVWQTLDSLSQVMHIAAREGASHHPVNIDAIARDLPLAALASRLRGVVHDGQVMDHDLDLF